MATYSSDAQLRVYRVRIDFERSRIDLFHVKVYNQFTPFDLGNAVTVYENDLPWRAQLSKLEFVPPGPKPGTRDQTPPFVLASFSYSSDITGNNSNPTSRLTVLCRVMLQSTSPRLHSCFESLSAKRNNHSSNTELPVSPFIP